MAYKTIGNSVIEWDDHEPLIFTLSEDTGSNDDRRTATKQFDLSGLRKGFEEDFLIYFKNLLIDRRNRVSLTTLKSEYENILLLFNKVITHELFDTKRSTIDESFLLALNTITIELSSVCLSTLKRIFNSNPNFSIFAQGLRGEDFPTKSSKKGIYGQRVDHILATALTHYACVEILRRCEEAYEDGEMDIGYFSFIHLAFAIYVRPESYRQIRLSDLVHDTITQEFFLYISPAKAGVEEPQKVTYRINKNVGLLLLEQRHQVIEKFGHLVDKEDIGKLAFFPARKLNSDKSGWISKHANEFFGEIESGVRFACTYFRQIRSSVLNGKFGLSANTLRHTIGTQLAELGCSANTIKAVLKHAGDQTCMAYVDIAFQGLINELSNAMRPAFETYLPVFQIFRSKEDMVAKDKAIYSDDLETGRIELTGECGKQIRCQAAPFTCYVCNKFIPCFDADHSLNLNVIQNDIEIYKRAGTPFKYLVEKAKTIKYRILLVMAACDRHQQAVAEQEGWP